MRPNLDGSLGRQLERQRNGTNTIPTPGEVLARPTNAAALDPKDRGTICMALRYREEGLRELGLLAQYPEVTRLRKLFDDEQPTRRTP